MILFIFLGYLDRFLFKYSCSVIILNSHHPCSGAITALAFSESGLISASEDCAIYMWDVVNWVIIRKFNHRKGKCKYFVFYFYFLERELALYLGFEILFCGMNYPSYQIQITINKHSHSNW